MDLGRDGNMSDTMRGLVRENPELFRPKMVKAEQPSVLGFLNFMHENMKRFMDNVTRIRALENIGNQANSFGRMMAYYRDLNGTTKFDQNTELDIQGKYFPEHFGKKDQEWTERD